MKINYKYLFIILFTILTVTQFYQLNKNPLQPWDEAMYASRVDYLLDSGNWLDQTKGSIDGLYFSSHPPLYIWLTAISVKVFGANTFGFRFWSLIFGLGCIILIFLINTNKERGFYSAFILATIPFFLAYSKLGQLDTIYLFFILLGLFLWKKHEQHSGFQYLIFIGISFGLAMMSKIIVGFFLPLSIGLFLFYQLLTKQKNLIIALKELFIIIGVGLAISLPWLIFMYLKHGQEFLNYYLIYHIFDRMVEGVEFNTEKLGSIFFINQLMVMLSVFVWIIIWKGKALLRNHKNEVILYLCFAFIPLLIFTVSSTKLRTYAIPMLPPLALIAGLSISYLKEIYKKRIVFFAGLAIFAAWSFSQYFRDHIQSLNFDSKTFIIVAIIIITSLVFNFIKISPKIFLAILAGFLILRVSLIKPIDIHHHEMDKYAEYYYENDFDYLVNLDTKRTVDDPLITYYFNRIDINKNPEYLKIRPENNPDFSLNYKNRNSLIIVNSYHENEFYKPYLSEIKSKGILMFEDDLYEVYVW